MAKEITIKIGDISLHPKEPGSKDYSITRDNPGGKTVYVVAFMTWSRDGYEVRFIGERPFQVPNFMQLAKMFHRLLMKVHYWPEEEEESDVSL